jgi:hypothetical protein
MTDLRRIDERGRVIPEPFVPGDHRRTFIPADAAEYDAAKRRAVAGLDPLGAPPVHETPPPAPVDPETGQAASEPSGEPGRWFVLYPGWDKVQH